MPDDLTGDEVGAPELVPFVAWFESWCDNCEVTIETPNAHEIDSFNAEHDHPVDEEFGHIELGAS